MENEKDNEDIVVSKDGSMSQGVNIEVTSQDESTEPAVNEIDAPPEPTVEDSNPVSSESSVSEVTKSEDSVTDASSESSVETEVVEEQIDSESDSVVSAPPSAEETPASDPFATSVVTPSVPATAQTMSNNEQSQPKEHRNNKKLALIVTILIAILLAGVAVYLFMSAEDNTEEVPASSQSTQQVQEEVSPATAEDVDQAVSEIDQTVQSIDDTTDLNEEAISDPSLGL